MAKVSTVRIMQRVVVQIVDWGRQNRVTVLFCLHFGALLFVFGSITTIISGKTPCIMILSAGMAQVSSWLIGLLGMKTTVNQAMVSGEYGFTMDIGYLCTGVVHVVFLVSGILAYPVSFRSKISGISLGVLAITSANIVRIVGLFLVGVHVPSLFGLAHQVIGQLLMIFITFCAWYFWSQRVRRV